MPASLSDLFATDLDPLLVLGHDHRITLANEGLRTVLGHAPDDVVGDSFVALVHPADREWIHAALQKVGRGVPGIVFDGRLHHADGGVRWMHWRFRRSPAGMVYAAGRDESVRRQVERTVRQRERRRRAMLDHAADPLVVLDDAGRVVDANAAMAALVDRTAASLVGTPIAQLIPAFGDHRPRHGVPFEARVPTRDGTVDLEIRTNAFTFEDETMVVALARDIGKRKAHTDALATLSIRATLQNEAKSTFVAEMSHAMRTPLSAILGYTEMMLEADQPAAVDLERVQASATWLLELVDDVLDLARIESGSRPLEPETTAVEALLQDVQDTLEPRDDTTLTIAQPDPSPSITTDVGRVRQVLTTLVERARKRANREVHVEVAALDQAGRALLSIAVTDDGPPLDDAALAAIFTPFARGGRGRDEPAGLGLAVAQRLTESLGGRLTATALPEGNRFTVFLPR